MISQKDMDGVIATEAFEPSKDLPSLDDYVSNLDRKTLEARYVQELRDQSSDEIEICIMAKTVLSEEQVYGDSNGVPTIVDIVEMLVKKITK